MLIISIQEGNRSMSDNKVRTNSNFNDSCSLQSVDTDELGIGPVAQLLESSIEMQNQIQKLEKELEALKKAVKTSDLLFSLEESAILNYSKLPSVTIKASDFFAVSDNYYTAEKKGGTVIRWTGPEKINVYRMPVDRSSSRVGTLYIANIISDTIVAGMRIYLDGELVKHDIIQDHNTFKIVFDLPVSQRLQDTIVTVYVDKLYSPKDLSESSSDSRLLGWAFKKIEVR